MATVELEQQRLLIGGEWVSAGSGREWEKLRAARGRCREPCGRRRA